VTTRREFLGFAASFAALQVLDLQAEPVEKAKKRLRLLFLGGTGFIGPHQIKYALSRGHIITIFNRGRRAGLFGNAVEELTGNRDTRINDGLAALKGSRSWDVVIDNSGYIPRHVRDSTDVLKGRVSRYLYVSTAAVYDRGKAENFSEDDTLWPSLGAAVERVNWQTYGPLKAQCDRIVRDAFGDNSTVVRPTYIIGPGDTTDRFTYWVDRIDRGGDVLAPSGPEREIQWVDARDLCPWMISLAEMDVSGIYNTAGPASPVTRENMMWGLRAETSAPIRFHWPSDRLLNELGISPPMFSTDPISIHFESSAAIAAGISYRALADSARDTLVWWRSQPSKRRENPRGWIPGSLEATAIRQIAGGG
jgi:2'-hydroxyisoflavone reductase